MQVQRDIDSAEGQQARGESWWYARHRAALFLLLLFLGTALFSQLVPPFQSPDEFNHLKRAYVLARGEVFLGSLDNVTGGDIDTGLLAYMQYFQAMPFQYAVKMTSTTVAQSERITFTGSRDFSEFPNTAGYFPLLYLPQALALLTGEKLQWSVANTYRLARLFSLLATIGLLWYAMSLYPVPLPVLVLFLTPMSLFQLSSASLDAITFSTSVLVGSLFMRGADKRYTFCPSMHAVLATCLFALAASRVYLAPLAVLPIVLFRTRRARSYLISTGVLLVLTVGWILYVLKAVKGAAIPQESPPLDIANYYVWHIGALARVIFATLTNEDILIGYWRMFVGMLGWLDTPLGSEIYIAFGILMIGQISLSLPRNRSDFLRVGSLALTGGGILSLILLFLITLVMWTPHPATVIGGIQGRYFYPTFMLFGFSMLGRPQRTWERRLASVLALMTIVLTGAGVVPRLLHRYWMS